MSTGIYKGIAVPHATVEGIDTLRGVLGISKKESTTNLWMEAPSTLCFCWCLLRVKQSSTSMPSRRLRF